MDRLQFDRWDFLGTKAVLLLVAVGTPLLSVGAPVWRWLSGGPLRWEAQTGVTDALTSPQVVPRDGTRLTWPGDLRVSLDDPDAGVWLASLLPGVVVSAAAVVIAVSLLRLVGRVQARTVFVRDSVRTLRVVALTLLASAVLVTTAGAVADSVVMAAAVETRATTATFTLDAGPAVVVFVTGLVVAALAEAFAHGTRLADDVSGLV